jgi:hypothetical protein
VVCERRGQTSGVQLIEVDELYKIDEAHPTPVQREQHLTILFDLLQNAGKNA